MIVTRQRAVAEVIAGAVKHETKALDFDTAAWVLYPSREYLPAKTRAFVDHVEGATD